MIKDQLTELYHRQYFFDQLEQALPEVLRVGQSLAIIYIDIDAFKSANDYFGHPAGDSIIVTITDLILQHLNPPCWAARVGGEEFVAVLPATSRQSAFELAEKIRLAVSAKPLTFKYSHRERTEIIPTTISLGIASLPEDTTKIVPFGDPVSNFLAVAEQALKQAKLAGRNCTR